MGGKGRRYPVHVIYSWGTIALMVFFVTIDLRISPICRLAEFWLQLRSDLSGTHLWSSSDISTLIPFASINIFLVVSFHRHSWLTLNMYIYVLKWDKYILFLTDRPLFCHVNHEKNIDFGKLFKIWHIISG